MKAQKTLRLPYVHNHGDQVIRIDRFSRLFDQVILLIFSFLDYNDTARIRAVSKRFNLLSIVSPYLYFKPNFNYRSPDIHDKCNNFENFLRLLLLRRRRISIAPPIQAIRLHWFSNNNVGHNIFLYELIRHASEGKSLQELDITIVMESLNTNLEAWQSLISECRSSLKILRLNCLYANNNSFLTWLTSDRVMTSLHTLTLRSLSMSDLSGYNLNIMSSTLQVLEIFDVYTSLQCSLNIVCASLKSLSMEDVSFSIMSNLNIVCPTLKVLSMKRCHFFKEASVSITAEALVRLTYESMRDRRNVCAKESFNLYAPLLREVLIIPSRRIQLNQSIIEQGPVKQLQILLLLSLKMKPDHDPVGYILKSTPSLQKLLIKSTTWVCRITDSELFGLFRTSSDSLDEHNFLSILQAKLRSNSIRFFFAHS